MSDVDFEHWSPIRGRRENAVYTTSEVPNYRGNPLIEALGPILDENQLIKLLPRGKPPQKAKIQEASPQVRLHLLQDIKKFYQPLQKSIEIGFKLEVMLRSEYHLRPHPLNAQREAIWKEGLNNISLDDYDDVGAGTSYMTILGLGGTGKTRTIKRILQLYPQIIDHGLYQGKHFTVSQIVFLHTQCPRNATVGGFCKAFFKYVDWLLKTNYYNHYVKSRGTSIDSMILDMANIANRHYLGVLVIDEIQNIRGAKEGMQLVNFLTQMSNAFGIPVIFIGTPEAEPLFTNTFRLIRRATGNGNFLFHHMEAESQDWELFSGALWKYQYVLNQVKLTPPLSKVLHSISGGIPDLAVKMFIAAQSRAILNGTETINAALLKAVAKDEFPWASEAVAALSLNTETSRLKYRDMFRNYNQTATSEGTSSYLGAKPEAGMQEQPETQPASPSPQKSNRAPSKREHRQLTSDPGNEGKSMIQIVEEAKTQNISPYVALKEAGFIRDASELMGY